MDNTKLLEIIALHKQGGYNFRERRHDDWTENYSLYRDKILTNRLTQRQSVNIPLMKYQIKTILANVDEPPALWFRSVDNDEQREVYYNEHWKYAARENKLVLKDIVDKKQVCLFGRSFKKLNIVDGKFTFEIIDPQDILVDRYIDPSRIDSVRFLCQQHIYKTLSEIEKNPDYDKEAIARLKKFYAEKAGLVKSEENAQDVADKKDRMERLGVPDVDNPVLGETYLELNENLMYLKYEGKDDYGLHLITTTVGTTEGGNEVLCKKPLNRVIGMTEDDYWKDHVNYTTWADDTERTDFWSDGVADILRMPNRIINAWFSQDVENRTLRNFGMNYYDSSKEGYVPQTFTPIAWGWYPVPGKPTDVVQRVEIPALDGNLDGINFVMGIAEKATAASATTQGAVETKKVTLGEVELALQNAKERIKSMEVFYNDSWEEFGVKYTKMLEAAGDKLNEIRITRPGREDKKMYTTVIKPEDWKTKNGYFTEVKMMKDKSQEDMNQIQILQAVKQMMPINKPLDLILKKKTLEFAGLTAGESQSVLEADKQDQIKIEEAKAKLDAAAETNQNNTTMPGNGTPAPGTPMNTSSPSPAPVTA